MGIGMAACTSLQKNADSCEEPAVIYFPEFNDIMRRPKEKQIQLRPEIIQKKNFNSKEIWKTIKDKIYKIWVVLTVLDLLVFTGAMCRYMFDGYHEEIEMDIMIVTLVIGFILACCGVMDPINM